MGAMTEQTKKCTRCGLVKPLSEFYRQKAAKDGHASICKTCRADDARALYARRGEEIRAKERTAREEERRELAWYRENFQVEGKPWNE